MFPEMFGYENTLFGPKGKAHKVLESAKRKFCGFHGLDARVPGVWTQTLGTGPWTPQNFLLRFPRTLWAFPFGPNNVFSYPNISGNIRNPFQRSNTIIPYIKLYLRTIPEFLVMSMISSGTPNNIRSPNHITHNKTVIVNLSVRTLWVRELCRHDRDTSPVNNQ